MNIQLIAIDPQKDFCDKDGSLFVPGATQDMDRTGMMVRRLKSKIDNIHVTLDSHRKVDIAHPIWFKDSAGNHPAPFTMISSADLRSGKWMTTMPGAYARTLAYLETLETSGRYAHLIWPEHCLIGSEGHNVMPNLLDALHEWEDRFNLVDFVTKGSNPWTEHFSAVQAEVPDPEDPTTQLNTRLIETVQKADIILVAGEALSHCVANTIRDMAAKFDAATIAKMVLLTDAMSNVPNPPGTTLFSDLGKQFIADLTQLGAKTSTTVDFLA